MRLKPFVKPVASFAVAGAVVAVMASLSPLAAAQPVGRQVPGMSQKDVQKAPDGKYIVELSAAPVALYRGGVSGIAGTASTDGVSLDRTTSAVDAYRAYLDHERAGLLKAVPGVAPFYKYDWAYAGFAAKMSFEQAQAFARQPGVAGVFPNDMLTLDTTHSPEFLGLSKPGGLWEQAGGVEEAGVGLVLGVIDTGITPESPSFASLAEPAPVPDGWLGTCDVGDLTDLGGGPLGNDETEGTQGAAIDCDGQVLNNKVIGARYFVDGFGADSVDPDDFISPRDVNGHGSHTSSTSGGNWGVPITVAGADLGKISGMAPRARIAMYKVCWESINGAGCTQADSSMAIDQAVADGVDAINYSISGSLDSANDPVATAFRGAAAAGIFVAASAGNSGPTPKTVAHNYPWVTTVAASTEDRAFLADVTLADGTTYAGSSISTGVGPAPAVYAKNAAADGVAPADAEKCFVDSLDPAVVAGKIVVCLRGVNPRVEKSQVVADAGGIGMVLANDPMSGTSTITERHAIPTVHLSWTDGRDVIDAVGRDAIDPDATLELGVFHTTIGDDVVAPAMSSFSSRGPALMAGGDILKPDITAPGVDILASLAGYVPNAYEQFGFESGTSMSSPHIAGIAILIKYLHPDWSPMAIKSSMITGAYQDNNQGDPIMLGSIAAGPFGYGGGHVEPQVASATPLVYESTDAEWVQWMCGTGQIPPSDEQCTTGGSIDASDLNAPSIAINDVAGIRETTRTVTNVSDAEVHAFASVDNPNGFEITITPDEITVPAGGTSTFTVRIEATTAPLDTWFDGSFTWTAGEVEVRSPVVVKAASFAATPLLVSEEASGSVVDSVVAGVETSIDVVSVGLDEAQVDHAMLTDPDGGSFPPAEPEDPLTPHVMRGIVDVPAGTQMARFELFADDYVVGTDLDMFVFKDGTQVGSSATGAVDEKVTIENPPAGEYHVYVDLWALPVGETEAQVYLHSWTLGDDGIGDFTVTPEQFDTQVGIRQDMTFAWTGLEGPPAGRVDALSPDVRRYLGRATYLDGEDVVATTLLRVDVGREGGPTTTPPTSEPPTTTPTTEPPTTEPPTTGPPTSTPVPTTTLPGTGGGDAGLYAGLGLGALLIGGLLVAMAARRLRSGE